MEMEWVTPVLTVRSVTASLAFYTGVLGFQEWFRWGKEGDEPAAAGLIRGGVRLVLDLAGPGGVPQGAGAGVQVYISVGGMDLDAYFREVSGRGARVIAAPKEMPWGDRTFTVADPDGYRITFARVAPIPPPQ